MELSGNKCHACAIEEEGQDMELRLETAARQSILGNIYVGQVENIASNIQAAFVLIAPGVRGYFPLQEAEQVIFASGKAPGSPLRPGDQILVQVSRDAMKGKLPALTANLNFTGKYLVLTTGEKKFGLSGKLSGSERHTLSGWLEAEAARPDTDVARSSAPTPAQAEKAEILKVFAYLKSLYEKVAVNGKSRTCFSLLYETEPVYLTTLRDIYSENLTDIVTDDPEIFRQLTSYLKETTSGGRKQSPRFYQDKLLPLYKLSRMENALDEVQKEKIWLNSGGFIVIQQTEAFVSIDVNSGKFTGKKKAEETYRKINLEAAKEISRQLRLRNLSGIILIDFINMTNPDHNDELFHVLQKYLRKDPVKCKAIDITPLHILEMTRKKVRQSR